MPLRREPLLAYCRSLPLATEDVKWGADLCFSIGGKMFAVFSLEGGAGFGCKATEDDFHAVTQLEGIVPSKYLAKHFWISIQDDRALPQSEGEELIRKSYELVLEKAPQKTKKAVAEARAEATKPKPAPKKTAPKKTAPKKPAAKKKSVARKKR
ncbi:MAG: MmcQ/YjbR family DNA-binding protein [Polyangiales bacterium]